MTGLESILKQIESDGQKEAEEQLTAARAKADEISEKAKAEGAEKVRAALKDGEGQPAAHRRGCGGRQRVPGECPGQGIF